MDKNLNEIKPNDKALSTAERISNAEQKKESKIFAFKRLSHWFEVDFTIKMFGVVVYHLHWPPNGH